MYPSLPESVVIISCFDRCAGLFVQCKFHESQFVVVEHVHVTETVVHGYGCKSELQGRHYTALPHIITHGNTRQDGKSLECVVCSPSVGGWGGNSGYEDYLYL